MACPYFLPMERVEEGRWQHPARLPLGCGWSGQCTAPAHAGEVPSPEELLECNLGYAEKCTRLPRERAWDSVRFGARTVTDEKKAGGEYIQITYSCERKHLPVEHGVLEFDSVRGWHMPHPQEQIRRMAECFLQTYLKTRKHRERLVS